MDELLTIPCTACGEKFTKPNSWFFQNPTCPICGGAYDAQVMQQIRAEKSAKVAALAREALKKRKGSG